MLGEHGVAVDISLELLTCLVLVIENSYSI
jgi:hypothetical protein